MTPTDIASLLVPYTQLDEDAHALPEMLLSQFSSYLDLLLRWNARTNLTAIRTPEEIVARHFGESLFAARQIFPAGKANVGLGASLADVGSGAGFPGLLIKLRVPQLHVTLIEAQQKKATFLREVVRALRLTDVKVRSSRAELVTETFDVVTLRAVERFERVVAVAAKLVRPGGRLALLVGEDQVSGVEALFPAVRWEIPQLIPGSRRRVVFLGVVPGEPSS